MELVSASVFPHMDSSHVVEEVGYETQKLHNSVAPEVQANDINAEALIMSGNANNHITLSGNQYVPSVRCEDTIVPMSLSAPPRSTCIFKRTLC